MDFCIPPPNPIPFHCTRRCLITSGNFPGREYTLLYGRWRDNLRPVAMNTAGELVRFYPASAMQKGDSIIFTRKTRQGTLQAVWRPSKQFGSDIEVTMTLRAAVDGYFSLITPTLATLSEKEMAWGVIPGHFQGRKLEPNFVWSYGYGPGNSRQASRCPGADGYHSLSDTHRPAGTFVCRDSRAGTGARPVDL